MNNVPFVPRSPAGRKIHNLARRHVRDDHDLRAAVHRALAERSGSSRPLSDDWARPAIDTRRRVNPPTQADHENGAMMQPVQGTPADVPTQIDDRRWRREALKLVAAAIVFGLVGALLVLVLRDNDSSDQPSAPAVGLPQATATSHISPTIGTLTTQTSPTVDATAALQATRQSAQQAAQQLQTATADSAIATTSASATANASLPSPGDVVWTTRVGTAPIALAVADGNLWVGNAGDGTLLRIDPATNAVVATIQVGTPGQRGGVPWFVVAHNDQIWVTDDAAKTILQIDPATNAIVKTIPLLSADGAGSFASTGLVVNDTGIWASDYDGGRVLNIDPVTGTVLSAIDMDRPREIAFGFGSIWVASQGVEGQRILRIDPASKQILETIMVERTPGFVATGADAVWVSDERSGTVTRIDPSTNAVVAEIDTGLRESRYVLVAFDKVWVNGWLGTGFDNGMLTIDPATNALSRYIDTVPGISWHIAEFDGSIWVTHADTNEVVRIDPTP